MITRLAVPKISANIEEITITAWLKAEGEPVRKGEPLLEITTAKACVEVESPRTGVLRKVLAKEKSVVPVGYVMALIGPASEQLPDVAKLNRRLLDEYRRAAGGRRRRTALKGRGRRRRVRATPAARRLARELGVDLAEVLSAVDADIVTEAMVKEYREKHSK